MKPGERITLQEKSGEILEFVIFDIFRTDLDTYYILEQVGTGIFFIMRKLGDGTFVPCESEEEYEWVQRQYRDHLDRQVIEE